MALIGKIRNNMWLVLVLLGLALAAFVIMDMTGSQNLGGGASPIVGSVEGQDINWNEFQITEKLLYSGTQADIYAKREGIWNYYLEKLLLEKEGQAIGLGVGAEELSELQFGQNLSPIIQNRFVHPQTGQVDRPRLNQIKSMIDNNSLNRDAHLSWYEIQKEIIKYEMQNKLGNLVVKSIYTPNWLAEMKNAETGATVDFRFVKIPFDQVSDEEVSISDSDLQDYINKNKKLFTTKEERRLAEYVVFDVFPTAEDSTALLESFTARVDEFRLPKESTEDSLYALGNNGTYNPFYFKAEDLGQAIEENVKSLNVGEVYGPYEDAGNYLAVKLIDKKIIPDSVQARHILRSASPDNPIARANANEFIDSLMNLVKTGQADFDSLAIKNSMDQMTAPSGGDLGYFTQGAMVPEFNNATFIRGKEGDIMKVTTQFGVHLVEITDQIFESREEKYKVAFIREPIIPSSTTQQNVLNEVNEIIADNRDLESLRQSIDALPDAEIERSDALRENDYSFANLGTGQTSRDIIQWMFDPATELGDVAPSAFTYNDPINYFDSKYVIVSLSGVEEAGLSSVNAVRNSITPLVLNKKKGEYLASKIKSNDLAEVAANYSVEVDTASNVSLSSPYIPNLGNEPKVIAGAFGLDLNSTSKPIIGNSGVFLVQPFNKAEAPATVNLPQVKTSISSIMQQQVGRSLLEAMKSNADIKDNRSIYY